ncbi:MAG: hypothetical protein FWE04_00975 [Oscillospiraceae bacterium]|nr:hypothetical protein [Oscillospiraceae bacterium]
MASIKTEIRLKKVAQHLKKDTYKGLTENEKKIVRLVKRKRHNDKEMNRFWRNAPRLKNGAVDWDSLDENTLKYFEHIYKIEKSLNKALSKFPDKNIDMAMKAFNQINIDRRTTSF